jgi:hypothetical protein
VLQDTFWKSPTVTALAVLLLAPSSAGCHTQSATPTPASSAPAAADNEHQLRDLYTRLVNALGRHDTAAQVALTCDQYAGDVQRRADADPILQIDFFGNPEDVRRLGVAAATDKLHAALAPASRQAVQAMVEAIIEGDAAQYKAAVQRVEQEGSSATLDRVDSIEISGDTATVHGAFTVKIFTRPPEVVDGSNDAVRQDGVWKDCTPPSQRR